MPNAVLVRRYRLARWGQWAALGWRLVWLAAAAACHGGASSAEPALPGVFVEGFMMQASAERVLELATSDYEHILASARDAEYFSTIHLLAEDDKLVLLDLSRAVPGQMPSDSLPQLLRFEVTPHVQGAEHIRLDVRIEWLGGPARERYERRASVTVAEHQTVAVPLTPPAGDTVLFLHAQVVREREDLERIVQRKRAAAGSN